MKIVWSPTAVSGLESIRDFIARDNPTAARKMANRIQESVNRLTSFPRAGRIGRVSDTREREIPGTSYIVAYIIQDDQVQIAPVLHGKRSWPESFGE